MLNIKAKFAVALCIVGMGAPAIAEDELTFFMRSAKGQVEAFFSGPNCAPNVRLVFTGQQADAFAENTTPASSIMRNVAQVLPLSCPALERITSRGMVDGRVVYNGIAEAGMNWEFTQLGVRQSGGLLGASGETKDRDQFTSEATFQAFEAAAASLVGKSFCARPASDGTCAGQTEFAQSEGGSQIVARYLLDAEGSEANLSYSALSKDGLLCNKTADVAIEVKGGALSEEGREEYSTMLRERIESSGEEVCTGFELKNGIYIMNSFDAEGRRLGVASELAEASGPVALRLEE